MTTKTSKNSDTSSPCDSRREFLTNVTVGFGAVGAVCAATPFVKTLAPADNVKALATTEVDISEIAEGESKTILWQGKPVFIKHRTASEIAAMQADDNTDSLLDPALDTERTQRPEWLVVMAVCTHLGCVPIEGGNSAGWICPCHGSQFDGAGRLRRGPAAKNLEIPPYAFLNDTTIKIG